MWGLATALGDPRAKVARRRAEGDTTPVEVRPEIVVEMLGAPRGRDVPLGGGAGNSRRSNRILRTDNLLLASARPPAKPGESHA